MNRSATPPTPLAVRIYEQLVAYAGEPDLGHQHEALTAAISKLIGIAMEHRAQRSLRQWHQSSEAFAASVDRIVQKGH